MPSIHGAGGPTDTMRSPSKVAVVVAEPRLAFISARGAVAQPQHVPCSST